MTPASSSSSRAVEAVLFVNTRSLKGNEWLEESERRLTSAGVSVIDAKGFAKVEPLVERLRQERGSGRLIIVGGGDGTLSAAANVLAKTDSVLGVLPLGTGNAFARDLDIPTDLDKAIEVITTGICSEVDLGVYDGGYFLNVATIGLTVEVARTLTVALKRRFGRFVYAIALARALKRTRPFQAHIETENGTTDVNTIQLVIGNGRYHGGPLPLSPTAAITNGSLRLYAVEATTTAALVKYAMLLPTGLHGVLKTVHSESTKGGTVTTNPIQAVVVDGEINARTPLTFSIEPLALKVMTAKSFKG